METIDLKIPKGWNELDDRQLYRIFRLKSSGLRPEAIKICCLTEWGGLRVVRHGWSGNGLTVFEYQGKRRIAVSAMQLAELSQVLDWTDMPPEYPVRIRELKGRAPSEADMSGVPFETYLCADNYYQGYLKTEDGTLLGELAEVLNPPAGRKPCVIDSAIRLCTFWWWISLKKYFTYKYPHFFVPATPSEGGNLLGEQPDLEQSVNSQIRALTKGDITKEAEILGFDTRRALTELNELAREAKETEAMLNRHGK